MRKTLIVALCLFIAMSCVLVGCKKKGSKSQADTKAADELSKKIQSGTMEAPDFTLTDQDGKEFKLSDHIGKEIIVLEWLNYDCPFVIPRYENGDMAKVADKYKDKGVLWVGINTTHYANQEANKEFADKYEVKYSILDDSSGKVGRMYKATNTPHIYIINKEGIIVYNGLLDNAHRSEMPEDEEYQAYTDDVLASIISGEPIKQSYVKPVGCTVKYAK